MKTDKPVASASHRPLASQIVELKYQAGASLFMGCQHDGRCIILATQIAARHVASLLLSRIVLCIVEKIMVAVTGIKGEREEGGEQEGRRLSMALPTP